MSCRGTLSGVLIRALVTASIFFIPAAARAQGQSQAQPSTAVLAKPFIKVTFPSVNVTWEKGKSNTVRWESRGIVGNVRIRLVSANRQVFELVGNVPNNGTHDCYVGPNLYNGVYKIQVMKMDYSVMGESAATVTIGAPKTPYAKVTSQAQQGKTPVAGKPLTKTGAAGTVGATGVSSTGGTHATGATAAGGTKASASSSQRGSATATSTAKKNMQVARVSEAELKSAKLLPSAGTVAGSGHVTATPGVVVGNIVVTLPHDGDIWEAGKEYNIQWQPGAGTGDVRIDLESTLIVGGKRNSYTIVERTANTGLYRFRVPPNWFPFEAYSYSVWVTTLDGKLSGTSNGRITVYTQDVDLDGKLMDPKIVTEEHFYVVYADQVDSLEFDVWLRNNGLRAPITIQDVVVRIVKEPEELVVYQEEWGYGSIYPRLWYKAHMRFNIASAAAYTGTTVNMKSGAYRVEVQLDPQNLLGENEELRQVHDDNKVVARWVIKTSLNK
jgi:hypothetical protein